MNKLIAQVAAHQAGLFHTGDMLTEMVKWSKRVAFLRVVPTLFIYVYSELFFASLLQFSLVNVI